MNKNMIGLFLSCAIVVSCAVKAPLPVSSVSVSEPLINVGFMPVVHYEAPQPKIDTPHKIDIELKKAYRELELKTGRNVMPYDTVLAMNKKWQNFAFTLLQRGMRRTDKNDSLIAAIHELRDTVNHATKKANQYYQEAANSRSNQRLVKSTFSMFDFIIMGCLIICTAHATLSFVKPLLSKKPVTL